MFEESASNFLKWQCRVGGGANSGKKEIYGMGCVIDQNHTLTAYHCWSDISNKCEYPIALRDDGGFKCKLIYYSEEHDVAIFKNTEKIDTRLNDEYQKYPYFSERSLFIGSTVGFISKLTLHETRNKGKIYSHLSVGTVSMMLRENMAHKFAISSTVMQHGFSGSPVFRQDGSIAGVITESLRFIADPEDPIPNHYVLPVVSSIFPLVEDINRAINTKTMNP